MGLVISPDQLASTSTASDGLPIGSLVKDGAVVRPNANGTVFYAAINGALTIGRSSPDVPVVQVTPAAFVVDPRAADQWRNLSEAFSAFARAKGSTVEAAKNTLPEREQTWTPFTTPAR